LSGDAEWKGLLDLPKALCVPERRTRMVRTSQSKVEVALQFSGVRLPGSRSPKTEAVF
jgi:hypothetical protein